MFIKNFLLKILIVSLAFGILQNFSVANAKTKIYDGVGYFALADKSMDYAKNQAKLDGARNIAEQVFVDVQAKTNIKNSVVQRDEIITMTEGLMKILEVKYKILADEEDENNFIIQATVTAEVDTDKLEENISELRKK